MGLLDESSGLMKSIKALPSSVLSNVASLAPTNSSHNDMDTYCKDKGGTMQDGKCVIPQQHEVSKDDHSKMMDMFNQGQTQSDATAKPDYSDYSQGLQDAFDR